MIWVSTIRKGIKETDQFHLLISSLSSQKRKEQLRNESLIVQHINLTQRKTGKFTQDVVRQQSATASNQIANQKLELNFQEVT